MQGNALVQDISVPEHSGGLPSMWTILPRSLCGRLTGAPTGSVFNAVAEAIPLREAAQVVAQATGSTGGAVSVSEADIQKEWGAFFTNLLASAKPSPSHTITFTIGRLGFQ